MNKFSYCIMKNNIKLDCKMNAKNTSRTDVSETVPTGVVDNETD